VHHISARFCRIFDVYAARVFFKMRHKTDVPSYSRGLLVSSVEVSIFYSSHLRPMSKSLSLHAQVD